jgi:hypothetical protein
MGTTWSRPTLRVHIALIGSAMLFASCSEGAGSATTEPPTTTSSTPETFSQDGLVCLQDLYEWSMSAIAEDYVGTETEEEAVEKFIASGEPLMKPHPRDLTYKGLDDMEATFLAEDGRPILILAMNDLGNGLYVESHRRCA